MTIRGTYNNFLVGTTPQLILPADNHRRCLLLSSPSNPSTSGGGTTTTPTAASDFQNWTNPVNNQILHSYTCPANTVSLVQNTEWHLDSGGQPTLLLYYRRAGTDYQITGTFNPDTRSDVQLYMSPGDIFKYVVSSGQTCTGHSWMSIATWTLGATGAPTAATDIQTWGNQTTNTPSQQYTVPAGQSAFCPMMTWCLDSGFNPTENGSVVRSGTRYDILFNISSRVIQTPGIWLSAGDIIEWFCTSGQNGSYHGIISLALYPTSSGGGGGSSNNQVWIGFGQSVTANTGIPIYGGVDPLMLTYDCFGTMLGADIYAVASAASTPLNVLVGYDADDLYCA